MLIESNGSIPADNTRLIPAFMSDQPGSYLRSHGLANWQAAYPGNLGGFWDSLTKPNVEPLATDIYTMNRQFSNAVRAGQMHGVGDFTPGGNPGDVNAPADGVSMTAINAEGLYLLNLYRAQTGQPPLPAGTYAPGVNVGLTTPTLLAIGALAYMVLKK